MPNSGRYRPNSPPILHETIDHETIVVNLDVGTYYALNRTGSWIWNGLVRGASVQEVAEVLSARSGASETGVLEDIGPFVEQLVAEDLLVGRSGGPPAEAHEDEWGSGVAYEPPTLKRYTDMQELLLLDPVHDVGVEGWPQRA